MKNSKAGAWIAGTAFVGVLILVAAWFLVISPVVATASEASAQASAQRDQNELTKTKIDNLKVQFANLDTLKADLAAMQLQIPTSYDLANYQRQLVAIAAARSVTISSVQFGAAVPVVPVVTPEAAAAAAVVAAAAAEAAAATENAATADAATAVAAPTTGVDGLNAQALSLDVVGTYPNVLAFLQDLQAGTQRVLLVESLAASPLEPAEASGGLPAANLGDLRLVVTGSLYVLADTAVAAVATDPAAVPVPPVLPVPDGSDNPFLPLG